MLPPLALHNLAASRESVDVGTRWRRVTLAIEPPMLRTHRTHRGHSHWPSLTLSRQPHLARNQGNDALGLLTIALLLRGSEFLPLRCIRAFYSAELDRTTDPLSGALCRIQRMNSARRCHFYSDGLTTTRQTSSGGLTFPRHRVSRSIGRPRRSCYRDASPHRSAIFPSSKR